jgi:hypothetical protein
MNKTKIIITEQASPYPNDEPFFQVLSGDKVIKQFIIEFYDAINFGLTLSDKVYYRPNTNE